MQCTVAVLTSAWDLACSKLLTRKSAARQADQAIMYSVCRTLENKCNHLFNELYIKILADLVSS